MMPGIANTDMIPDDWKPYATDDPGATGALALYLSQPRADFLKGGVVSVKWDLEEVEARKDEIVEKQLLKVSPPRNHFSTARDHCLRPRNWSKRIVSGLCSRESSPTTPVPGLLPLSIPFRITRIQVLTRNRALGCRCCLVMVVRVSFDKGRSSVRRRCPSHTSTGC